MRLRVESDGTVPGTVIRDADTGDYLDLCIREFRWSATAGDAHCVAVIEVGNVEFAYTGDVELADGNRVGTPG